MTKDSRVQKQTYGLAEPQTDRQTDWPTERQPARHRQTLSYLKGLMNNDRRFR